MLLSSLSILLTFSTPFLSSHLSYHLSSSFFYFFLPHIYLFLLTLFHDYTLLKHFVGLPCIEKQERRRIRKDCLLAGPMVIQEYSSMKDEGIRWRGSVSSTKAKEYKRKKDAKINVLSGERHHLKQTHCVVNRALCYRSIPPSPYPPLTLLFYCPYLYNRSIVSNGV